jgi:hypothetical protein
VRRPLAWIAAAAALAGVAVALIVLLAGRSGGGGGSCSPADATGCSRAAGRTLMITNPREGHANGPEYFTCKQSLLSITHPDAVVTGSGWPVKVHISFPPGRVLSDSGFSLSPGCEGDGKPGTIDLVVEIEGDGRTRGFADDAFKVKSSLDPHGGIQVTARLDCGPAPQGVHQDGIQLQGGKGIGFYDVEIGDWEKGTATCQGAGGGFFISQAWTGVATDIVVERMHSVTCNHGLGINKESESSGTMIDSGFRAKNPADAAVGMCEFQAGACVDLTRAPRWTFEHIVCDDWPYGKNGSS